MCAEVRVSRLDLWNPEAVVMILKSLNVFPPRADSESYSVRAGKSVRPTYSCLVEKTFFMSRARNSHDLHTRRGFHRSRFFVAL